MIQELRGGPVQRLKGAIRIYNVRALLAWQRHPFTVFHFTAAIRVKSMDRRSVCSKTAKGLQEATGKTSLLSRELRNVLKEVDGRLSVEQLQKKLEKYSDAKMLEFMNALELSLIHI